MLSLPTVVNRRIREAVPTRSAWIEAWGFFLVGLGIFLGLACYTYSPYDILSQGLNPRGVANLAGPWGAYAAAEVLGHFGVIGLTWPVAFVLWGALTATGFVVWPAPRRVIGFLAVAATLAGFCSMLLPLTALPEPSFGFGGITGAMLKAWLLPQLGFGGTIIALAVIGIVSLVLSGNLTASRTAEFSSMLWYGTWRLAKKGWRKYILNRDTRSESASISANVRVATGDFQDTVAASSRKPRKKTRSLAGDDEAAECAIEKVEPSTSGFQIQVHHAGPLNGKPSASIFSKSTKTKDKKSDFPKRAELLTQQLAEFKIMGKVKKITQGPVVTTYEFEPAPGTKLSKISALAEDLARMLKAQSLRVLAPIPGKDTVGFEVPNQDRAMIGLAELVSHKEFKSTKRKLPIAMGVDIFGKPIFEDLTQMPHLLVAGSTGSGKSVFMNTLIASLVCRHTAKDLRFIMIDPKMVEMAAYNDLPHMACPVITDPHAEAKAALDSLAAEMDDRYQKMQSVSARNIDSFNEIVKTKRKGQYPKFQGKWAPFPYIVLIIDELADMMMTLGKEAEIPITRLAQKARACGIHLVIATQRPSAEVVTGLIKANFPTRVAFRVLSGIDSRTILDQSGAETLLGKGDMLHLASGGVNRVHGAFLSEKEVQSMVRASKRRR